MWQRFWRMTPSQPPMWVVYILLSLGLTLHERRAVSHLQAKKQDQELATSLSGLPVSSDDPIHHFDGDRMEEWRYNDDTKCWRYTKCCVSIRL